MEKIPQVSRGIETREAALKPICDSMGLAWNRQRARIQNDPILSEGVVVMTMPSPGGVQETGEI